MINDYMAPYTRVGGYTVTHSQCFFFFLWLGESIAEFKNRLNYTRKKKGPLKTGSGQQG